MSIKDFIQLVEQADIPNMQILGQLSDGFAYIQYNGMAGVLDQQSNKMILISLKVPNSYHIVTVAGGREMTDYVGADQIGPATKKALDSITPRQRPRPPAPLPSQESYESTEQVRSIVQRMMEDARVPQKPRQGPIRPQTGAGKHKDKKKDQKQGKAKHKGKELDEGRFDRGRDDQFSLGGRLERDNDFRNRERNAGVEHERNNYQVSINGKPWKVFADQRQAMNIARSLRMKGKEVEVYPTGANPSESVGEAVKKPNATTRHLRDYPVSDKDMAKPVKKPEKEKPEQGVAEGKPKQLPTKGADYSQYDTDHLRTLLKPGILHRNEERFKALIRKELQKREQQGVAEGSRDKVHLKTPKHGLADHPGRDTGVGLRTFAQTPEQDRCPKCNSLFKNHYKQGVAEGKPKQLPTKGADYSQYDTDHLRTLLKPGILHRNEERFKALIRKELQKREQQGVAEGSLNELDTSTLKSYRKKAGDEVNAIKQKQKLGQLSDKDFFKKQDRLMGITGASKRIDKRGIIGVKEGQVRFVSVEQGVAEEKQKGVDGKACWKGYKRMGTKKKGGRTVDNCVKMESISEGILSSFGLMEKSPPGFKGTVKAMKKHPELTKGKTKDGKEKNPWALAWHMKNKGYKSHKKADGSDKD